MAAPPSIALEGDNEVSQFVDERKRLMNFERKAASSLKTRETRGNQSILMFLYVLAFISTIALCTLSIKWVDKTTTYSGNQVRSASPQDFDTPRASSSLTARPAGVLNVFQVSGPVLGPQGIISNTLLIDGETNATAVDPEAAQDSTASRTTCSVMLMKFTFSNSFGKPFVGDYSPPSCMENSNTVIMNFTVESKGIQFDRLALMYLGDTEVFRTSTAEPTRTGIRWEYVKDMSHYMTLWKRPQKIIFDLANIVDSNFTGVYNTTLTATFFTAPQSLTPADMIIPISTRRGLNTSAASVFAVPTVNATNTISFPRNANRAVFSISSCGQGTEEFWWSNSLQTDTGTFEGGTIPGFSPFREVQLFIDGQMAGVQWPFPILFTGGVVPGLWSPAVGIDAFDLKEYEIDITAWLPLLCDGNQHTFTMQVAGLLDDGRTSAVLSSPVATSWSLTGKIFVWLDATESITTGTIPTLIFNAPTISVSQSRTQSRTGSNETLSYAVSVRRTISLTSTLKTASGTSSPTWTQTLSYNSTTTWLSSGNTELNTITTSGTDTSTGPNPYTHTYSFPLFANTTAISTPDGNLTLAAQIIRSKNTFTTAKTSIYPSGLQSFSTNARSKDLIKDFEGTKTETTQNGTAFQFVSPGTNTSAVRGESVHSLRFAGVSGQGALGMEEGSELYYRRVRTANGSLVGDVERVVGRVVREVVEQEDAAGDVGDVVGVQQVLGRVPGLQNGNDALLVGQGL